MPGPAATSYWIHEPHPFLIQFTENFGIRYYGLAYLAGFITAGWLLLRYHRAGRSALDLNGIFDLMTWLIGGVIIGGRLGSFLLYHPEELFNPPWAFFLFWQGGMASHGGFVGVILAMWLFARRSKLPFLQLTDIVVTTVPAGLFFGRIANFINGELWGKVTTVPWAVIFAKTDESLLPRHPSQFYEAALEGLLLFAYAQWRFWKTDCTRAQPGRLSGEFLVAYAVVRILGERFREPDEGVELVYGLSRGTYYSLVMLAGGLAVMALSPRRNSQGKA